MRALILSDLHSNLEALQATLGYARGLAYDRILVLGDIVGYGPDPNPVVEALRGQPRVLAIRGNHDRVATGLDDPDDFNDAARASAMWTRSALEPGPRDYLRALPQGPVAFAPGGLLAHGSPLDEDQYLLDPRAARNCFDGVSFDVCFFGHSHLPCCFALEQDRVRLLVARGEHAVFVLTPGGRYLINPGSLGQPRDRNPRCSFALYDDAEATVTIHRLEYPLERTRDKILAAGLPPSLGDRLRVGA